MKKQKTKQEKQLTEISLSSSKTDDEKELLTELTESESNSSSNWITESEVTVSGSGFPVSVDAWVGGSVSIAGSECKVVPREVCGAALCPLVNEPECRLEEQTVSSLISWPCRHK